MQLISGVLAPLVGQPDLVANVLERAEGNRSNRILVVDHADYFHLEDLSVHQHVVHEQVLARAGGSVGVQPVDQLRGFRPLIDLDRVSDKVPSKYIGHACT